MISGIRTDCPIAVNGQAEFSKPVVRSRKVEVHLGRLLCSVKSHWSFGAEWLQDPFRPFPRYFGKASMQPFRTVSVETLCI